MEDIINQPINPIFFKQKNFFKVLFFVVFILLLTTLFFIFNTFFLNKNGQKIEEISNINQEKKQSDFLLPTSTDKTIPILKDGLLYQYSIVKKTLEPTEYKTDYTSGAVGFGEDTPLLSPDGNFIAFINRNDNSKLYILPTGNQKATKITDYSVEYLNSWSSDSSKILYSSNQDNLISRKGNNEMGGTSYSKWETVENFVKNSAPGFHSFNIKTGNDIFLYPIASASQFIDSNQILIEIKQDYDDKKVRFVLFNVDTFTADYSTVNYIVKSYGTQMSFSSDGKYWATNFDQGNYDNSRLIYTKFPELEGNLIDSGRWGYAQRPILNHNSQYLAYAKKDKEIRRGLFLNKTIIWDTSSKKVVEELNGSPRYWVDDNILLISQTEYETKTEGSTFVYLFNLNTKEKTIIQ